MSRQSAQVYANLNEAVHFASLNISPIDSPDYIAEFEYHSAPMKIS